jgi:hypothetical protein
MRKPDLEVREVVCFETGKPMPKIPPWMAGIEVKFVSDEARQKHPTPTPLIEIEARPRATNAVEILKVEKVRLIDADAEDDEEDGEEAEGTDFDMDGAAEDGDELEDSDLDD